MKAIYDSSVAAPAPSVARVQKPAPHFSEIAVVNGEFKQVSLDDFKGKYFVLFLYEKMKFSSRLLLIVVLQKSYPLDFTFVCPTEIIAFSDRAEEFHKIDCNVAAGNLF